MLRQAVVAVGSNLEDRERSVGEAMEFLRSLNDGPDTAFAASGIHETTPVDCPPGAGLFLNAAATFLSRREPLDLLDELQGFERAAGRPDRRERNAPRTVDLDLLVLGSIELASERLTLPHPRMLERLFVLEPLAEILPLLIPPRSDRTVAGALEHLKSTTAGRLATP